MWHKWTCLGNRNWITDTENRLVAAKEEGLGEGWSGRLGSADVSFFFFFLINLLTYLFIYFWLPWVFVAACGLSLVEASRGYPSLRCTGFSSRWPLPLWSTGSRHTASAVVARGLSTCGSWALERRLSSCGAQAQPLHGTWDPPGPGIEPVSSASAGGPSTNAPPGKSQMWAFIYRVNKQQGPTV